MNQLAKFFIENYKLTLVLSAFVVVFGVMGLLRINAESYPAVNFAMATITTSYDGASAEDIETRITKPIEDEIRTVSGLKDVKSISQPGRSIIVVRADIDNIVVEKVMGDLQRAIDRVSNLPSDLRDPPTFTEIKSEEFPVIEIAITGSNKNRRRDLAADLLKEEIEDNKSVLGVRLVGYHARAFMIELDAEKLEKNYIGIDEILAAITKRNVNIPGGKLEAPGAQTLIRIEGKITNAADIENITVRAQFSGRAVYLKDVATIRDFQEDSGVRTAYNGEEATLLIVNKRGGTDTIALVNDVDQKIESFKKKYDNQLSFNIYANEARRVENKLSVLSSNAITGLVLVIFFLLLFLPGKIGFMAGLSLPLSVMAVLGIMPLLHYNLNAVTILALVIALGMLVDNSVVISENYARLRSEGKDQFAAASESIRLLWLPITATAFTTIAAFMPMLVTKGIMGQFIKYIPVIVSAAIFISLVESFFLLPMRLTLIDRGSVDAYKNLKANWFDRWALRFEKLIYGCIRHRYLTLLGFLACIVLSFVMIGVFNKMILFPSNQTEIYISRVELPKGATQSETLAKVEQASKAIHDKIGPFLKDLVGRAGTAQMGPTDPKGKDGDNMGMVTIYVTEEARDTQGSETILAKLREIKVENVTLQFEAQANGPPVGDPLNVTLRSNDREKLNIVVNGMVKTLEETAGVRDVQLDDVFGDDKIFVDIDYTKAGLLGLDVNSVGNVVRSAISGKNTSEVNLKNKEVQLRVRMQEKDRLNENNLKMIKVMDKRGYLVPLASFAKLRRADSDPYIKRFDYKRARTLTAGVDPNVITAAQANKLAAKTFAVLSKANPEVSLTFGGEGESTKESLDSLFNAMALSLILIFAILVFLFKSFLRPFIIMTTIPLGLVGFSVAFALHQKPVSFMALIGVIGLGGIIVNAGIILIEFIEELRREKPQAELIDILAEASRLRLRAVVVSSLTTISGLFPTAYGIGGADMMLMPLTLAMAWGLTSGTILTLIWVPCAYAILEDIPKLGQKFKIKKKFFKKADEDSRFPEAKAS